MNLLWRLRLFAGLSLEDVQGNEIRRFRSQRVGALLAYLALRLGRATTREELAEALWPDDDPEATANRLRVTLASLRKQLEPPGTPFGSVLDVSVPGQVRLRPDALWCDATAFEQALGRGERAEAGALYQGELMPGYWDDWILQDRARFAALAEGLPAATLTTVALHLNLPTLPRRLPTYLTRFFGREHEREQVRALLLTERVVTLVGPGGIGKTRLAVEAAGTLTERAVWFVGLADLWEGNRLLEVIRDTLGLPRTPVTPLAQLVAYFSGQDQPLLILDNLEQLAPYAGPVLTSLLQQTDSLTLLITSRRRLEIPGEWEFIVPTLPIPPEVGEETALATLAATPAIALFVDRARTARPDFQLTVRNAADIQALCALLLGLPLGLELTAARSAVLTPAQMHTRLLEHWNALPALARTEKAERHRSLRAAIEWSIALLPPDQKRLFLQLSIFRGGATLEAIEAICEFPFVLEMLSRLRAHSLLRGEESQGTLRFAPLEVLRQWAQEQLPAEEEARLGKRHVAWYLDFVAQHHEPYDALEMELPNLRIALARSLESDPATYQSLVLTLVPYWEHKSQLREGREWLERALETNGSQRAALLLAVGGFAARQGDTAAALLWLEEGQVLATPDQEAGFLAARGVALQKRGDLQEARALFEQSLGLARARGEVVQQATLLNNLGATLRDQGDYRAARTAFEQSIALAREQGTSRSLAHALNNLAALLTVLSEEGAAAYYAESLALKRGLGDTHGVATTLSNLAVTHCRAGNWAEARTLTEEVCTLFRQMGERRNLAIALNRLGQIAVAQEKWDEGARHLSEALTLRLALGNAHDITTSLIALSDHALAVGQPRRAALFLGAAHTWITQRGHTLPPDEAAEYQQHRAAVQAALSRAAFQKAHTEGEGLTQDQIRALMAQPR